MSNSRVAMDAGLFLRITVLGASGYACSLFLVAGNAIRLHVITVCLRDAQWLDKILECKLPRMSETVFAFR